MKRVLVIMPVLLLLVQCVFAQINTYPWTEDFESNSFATNGWNTSIISGSAEWGLGTGDSHSTLASAHSGTTNAIISNSEYEGDTALLLSPVFARPNVGGTIKISFYYASPDWSGDFDELIVKYIDAENSSTLLTIAEITYEWTLATIDLPVSGLAETFQIGFVGVPKYGYGFLLDDVTLDFEESTFEVDTYPWCEDFEIASLALAGWTSSILSGSANWRLGAGTENSGSLTSAHSSSTNALISNTASHGDTAVLVSPVFVRPTGIDTLDLTFYYANPIWGSDYDNMIVKLIDGTDETELAVIGDYHDNWTRMKCPLVVSELPENFQIAFVGIPHWGYGFLIDDVCIQQYEAPVLDVIDTETYRQVGTGEYTQALPVETSAEYSYSQQIFLSEEMGGQKTIYSLSFNYAGNVAEELHRYVKVYMANTEKSSFSSYYDFMRVSDMTKVYSGELTIPAESNWATIVLETPFAYDGTSNLMLAVLDNSGTIADERLFYCSEKEDRLSFTATNDYPIDIDGYYLYGNVGVLRNNVRFGIEEVEPVEPSIDVEETSAYLQVGTNTSAGRNMLPVNAENIWSLSQQIFSSREMGGEKNIYSLSFNYLENPNGNISRNIKVYLAHTDMPEFDDAYNDVVDWADMTKVYSGRMMIDGESGWTTIALNAPFHYNGVDNLIVAVMDVTGSSEENPVLFACSSVEKSRAVAFSSYRAVGYESMYSADGDLLYSRSNIRFGLEYVEPEHYVVDTVETDAYLQIGTGNVENVLTLPVQTDIRWSYSQQIFKAEDFGGSRTIYSLAFNYTGNTNGEFTRNVKAYLGYTQKDEFDSAGDDFVDVTEMTKVYSGLMRFDAESGWTMLVLENPFVYNGTDNLVLAVVDVTEREDSEVPFVGSNVVGSLAVSASSYYPVPLNVSSFSVYNCVLHYYRNNVRFGLEYVEPPAHLVDTIETAEYLQVGTGTEESEDLPTNTNYSYSYSQQLFLAYEMGGPRTIYTVSFSYSGNSNSEFYRNLKLYMGHTSSYEYDLGNDWVRSNLLNVSSQNVLIDEESGLITFVLRTPFNYNGTDNLVVAVRDNTGEYVSPIKFQCSNIEYQSAMSSSNDWNAIYDLGSEYGTLYRVRNNVRFGLEYVEPPVVEVDTIETDGYLQVGTGNSIREALPVNTAGKYGYSQQIFNVAEMGGARTIYSVSLNCVTNSTADAVRNVRLYMGNVNAFEFEYNDWVDVLGLEVDDLESVSQVYEGDVTIPANSGWLTVILDQPFEYNGTDNLMVAWLDNTGVSHTERHFACTSSSLGNSIIATRNIGSYDLGEVGNISGMVLQYRNNIRFGVEQRVVYTLDVTSNDNVMGKVSGYGRYEEGSVVNVSATAYPCFKFSKWSDGVTANPRQVEMTSDISLLAQFVGIESDTLNYDNDVYNISLGYHQQNVEWGILLLPQHLASRPHLADVLFYVDGQYSYGEYNLAVYQGFDTIPTECVLRDAVIVPENTEGWQSFGFDTLDIDTDLPLWVILSSDASYPAVASTFHDDGYENGAWWNPNGTWTQQNYGAWMIKAVLPVVEDENEVADIVSDGNIGIYPNPVNSFMYIEGVEFGEPVEIYSIEGRMIAYFIFNGDAVDVAWLPAGMYVLRSNGSVVRFVKE